MLWALESTGQFWTNAPYPRSHTPTWEYSGPGSNKRTGHWECISTTIAHFWPLLCFLWNKVNLKKGTRSESLVHKRLLDANAEAKFSSIMRQFKPSSESSLCQIVQKFPSTMSTVLDTPQKVKKVKTDRMSPWLRNTSIKDKKRCRTAERKWRKSKCNWVKKCSVFSKMPCLKNVNGSHPWPHGVLQICCV